jgi:hypothetical protein
MDDRRKLIKELEERSKKNQTLEAQSYAALGEYFFKTYGSTGEEGLFAEKFEEIRLHQGDISANSTKSFRIREIVRRMDDIRSAFRDIEEELDRIEKENLPIYKEVGRTVFETHRETTADDPVLDRPIADIRGLLFEISTTDEKVTSLKEAPKERSFLEKIFESSKVMFLNSSRALKFRNLEKNYQKLGKLLLEQKTGFIPDSPDMKEFLTPYFTNRDKVKKLSAKAEGLTKEQSALDEELVRLGVEKRYQKRLKDLEIQNEKTAATLQELFLEIGRGVFEKMPEHIPADERLSGLLADIEDFRRRSAENADEMEKLKAAIEVDGLNRKIFELKRSLDVEEEEVRRHQAAAASLKETIAETEKEKKRYDKIRR